MSGDGAVISLLNTNALLAPAGLGWLLLVDFNMDMLHLMAKREVRQRVKSHPQFGTLMKGE